MNEHTKPETDNPQEIERDIVATRSRMSHTLSELSNRANSSDILDGIYQWGRRKLIGDNSDSNNSQNSSLSDLGRIASENKLPVALGLAAIGSSFINSERVSHKTSELRNSASDRFDSVKESTGNAASSAKEKASDLTSSLKEKTSAAASTISDKVSGATDTLKEKFSSDEDIDGHYNYQRTKVGPSKREKMKQLASSTGEKTSEYARQTKQHFNQAKQENPLALGAGALIGGLVLGLILPKSRREEEVYGETANKAVRRLTDKKDELVQQAKDTAHEKTAEVKETLQAKVEEAKQTAHDKIEKRGLKPDDIAERANNKIEEVGAKADEKIDEKI